MEHFKKYLLLLLLFLGGLSVQLKAQQPVRNLSYFLDEAVLRSPLLKDYSNQQQALSIDSMRIRAGYKPQVTASSAGMYAPVRRGYGYDEVITNGQALEALLNVNYNLSSKKNISNQLEAVKLQADSVKFASGLSLLDLQKAITDQYINTIGSQQQAAFNQELYILLSREEQLLKKLTRSNVYKQVDYLTFLVTLQQQKLQWNQAQLQLKNDYSNLNYLTGIKDTTLQTLAEPVLRLSAATENKFFIQRFSIDSARIENQRRAVDLSYRPKAGVYANGGYNSSLVYQPYRNFGASVGFTITIPIYDGHQKKMQYNQLSISRRTTDLYKEFFSTQQAQQLALLKQQVSDQNILYQQVNDQIRFTKGLIDVDSKLLQTGDIRVADFVIAVNNYMAAQNLLRQTNINRLKLINQLNYWNR